MVLTKFMRTKYASISNTYYNELMTSYKKSVLLGKKVLLTERGHIQNKAENYSFKYILRF